MKTDSLYMARALAYIRHILRLSVLGQIDLTQGEIEMFEFCETILAQKLGL